MRDSDMNRRVYFCSIVICSDWMNSVTTGKKQMARKKCEHRIDVDWLQKV